MPKKLVRCPYGGHHVMAEIPDGYVVAKAHPQDQKLEGTPGHKQVCPICNRQVFVEYIK